MSTEDSGAPVSEEQNPENSAEEVIKSIDGSDEVDSSDATDDELAEVIESDEVSEEEKAEAKVELIKRLKLKVNGREVEEEIDFSDDDRLRDILQKGYAADEKFQKASEIEKRSKLYAELVAKNPLKALEEAGHNMDELAEAHMQKRIEDMQKSPEQKRLEELEAQIESERERNSVLERERQEAEQSRAQEQYSRELDEEIGEALQSSELPKSPYVVKRIAENLMLAMDEGYEDVTVAQILPIVDRQIKEEIRQMFEAMPEDVIEKTLGNNVSDKLRKRRVARQKKAPVKGADIKATGQSEIKKIKSEQDTSKSKTKAKDFWKGF